MADRKFTQAELQALAERGPSPSMTYQPGEGPLNTGDDDTTTVGELIAALQLLPPDMPVKSEGCDCWGEVVAVQVFNGRALIRRNPFGSRL
jgi:hypothetical protein